MSRSTIEGSPTAATPPPPVPRPAPAALGPADALAPEALLGTTIGNFKLMKVIGYGGFGVVYLAEHIQLKHLFALKLVRSLQKNDADILRRFQREANTLAALNHPNIVRLKDFGQFGEYGLYFVMEYLRGIDLKQAILQEYPLSVQRVRGIMRQICDALSYMHEKKIFHRDLKPANVILVPQADGGELVKLIDFGIASTVGEDTSLTQTGMLMGSVPYISPEQARGNSAEIDARSDLYSLGILLYQILTRELPYQSEHIPGLLTHHLFTPPPPLKKYRPDQLWSPELDAFISKAIAKKPAERFPDSHHFWQELRLALDTQGPIVVQVPQEGPATLLDDSSLDVEALMPLGKEDLVPATFHDDHDGDLATVLLNARQAQQQEESEEVYLHGIFGRPEPDESTRLLVSSLYQPEQPLTQGDAVRDDELLYGSSLTFGPSEQSVVYAGRSAYWKGGDGEYGDTVDGEYTPLDLPQAKEPKKRRRLGELLLFLFCLTAGGLTAYSLLPSQERPTKKPLSSLPSLRQLPADGRKAAKPFVAEAGKWVWRLSSTPLGAGVFRGKELLGKTPIVLQGKPGDTLKVTLQMPGYQPLEASWKLITADAMQTLVLQPMGAAAKKGPMKKAVDRAVNKPRKRARRRAVRRRAVGRRMRPRRRITRRRPPPPRRMYDVADPF